MGRGPRWTEDDHANLAAMVKGGMTDDQIAQAMGRTTKAIRRMREIRGISRGRRIIKMDDKQIAAIELARARGMTWAKIGSATGFSPCAICNRYSKAVKARKAAITHTD